MMAQQVPHQSTGKKRVKVYELRNNDWFDRGTGFCSGTFTPSEDGQPRDPRVVVESEDQPERLLLETKICKEDGFQKQQETLIVWTEPSNGVDMALSFQEPDGCALIWKFVHSIQQSFSGNIAGPDDSLSDDLGMEMPTTVALPAAELGNLREIEVAMRSLSNTTSGRDALAKFILREDYLRKMIPLVEMSEDFESLQDLHSLCNIMKTVILLNDAALIEHVVSDECVTGVIGALEYDPDFPSHKANHRQWLNSQGRYKEVVPIEDEHIRRKIHQTYRLQYLKDVVLARILDDPTFSVLNSIIFFNQVEIVQHLQANSAFLSDLFGIFKASAQDTKQKKDAIQFIQQCCAIAKNIQPPARQTLYNNFIGHGLLHVIHFGLGHSDVGVRVGTTDILVSLIDHDPQMIRSTIYRQINESQPPLTDSLIELLLVEVDLGVKSQISDALKVLLDGVPVAPLQENFAKANGEFPGGRRPIDHGPQQELLLARFYETSAVTLFKPLLELETRPNMTFTALQAAMLTYLIEILCFFTRQHYHRSKIFVLHRNIAQRVAQLLHSDEKFLRLLAIRFFRQLLGLQDEFYVKHLMDKQIFGPILEMLVASMPRDNLIVSSCLEFFEFIRKEDIKDLDKHLVQNYRDQLVALSDFETFRDLIMRYDQSQGFTTSSDYFIDAEENVARPPPNVHTRLMEHIQVDPTEEEYWNTSDDEEDHLAKAAAAQKQAERNGAMPTMPAKRLVDYASDEEVDENVDPEVLPATRALEAAGAPKAERESESVRAQAHAGEMAKSEKPETAEAEESRAVPSQPGGSVPATQTGSTSDGSSGGSSDGAPNHVETTPAHAPAAAVAGTRPSPTPPGRMPEKRRREEDDDELGKLMQNKRRNSSSAGSNASTTSPSIVKKKKSFSGSNSGTTPQKIAISITPAMLASAGVGSEDES